MRVAVVTHYFPPETGAPQARLSELARAWAAAGDDVCVLTGMPNHPTGVVPPRYRGRWRADEQVDGYRVVRTWLYATPNEGVLRKSLGHLSFLLSAVLLGARRVGPTDVVVVSSPTFFSIFAGWFLARRRRAKFVVEVRDLWPAIFVELGVLTNRRLIGMLERLELATYRVADAVVVVSEGFRDNLLSRGIEPAKVHVVRNGVDLDRFGTADARRAICRSELGAGVDDVLVAYVGAHGISHGLTTVADAAGKLRDEHVRFAFVGEGSAKQALASHVRDLGLSNVLLRPGVPAGDVPGVLAAADICLAPLRDIALFSSFIPSKIFEYLAAGKAVIGSVRGEPAAILAAAGGLVIPPEDAGALADAITALAGDPERRAEMGRRGRAYVEANFDRRVLADRYRRILLDLCDPGAPAPTDTQATQQRQPTSPLTATAQLARYVWSHPGNRDHRARAIGRLIGWQVWERLVRRPLDVRMVGGQRLRCHPHATSAAAVVYCGLPDWMEMNFLRAALRPGDVFVDVGANVGVYTLLAAGVRGVEIWAFEPSTDTWDRLVDNITRNNLGGRVHASKSAVSDAAGTGTLSMGEDTTNRLVAPDPTGAPPPLPAEPIDVVTLDGSLPPDASGRVRVIKVDVEGFEPEVLRGAWDLLAAAAPALLVEANDVAAIREVVAPFGYQPFAYDPDTGVLEALGWSGTVGNNLLLLTDAASFSQSPRPLGARPLAPAPLAREVNG